MTTIDRCPVCSGTHLNDLYSCKDYTVSHETFQIKICGSCALGITTPRPDSEKLDQYYLSDEYISHSGNTTGIVGSLYRTARKVTLGWKQKLAESQVSSKNKSVLDFGCGTGEFLLTMKKKGWTIAGVEPSNLAREKADNLLGITTLQSLKGLGKNKFSAITLWHVLEHVPDLNETLSTFHQLLDKHGALFVAVPNYQSSDAQHYKQYWAGFDVPRHLWHFSKESMTQLLNRNGFELATIKPMILDSFYISLLSEKYQGKPGYRQYVNGFVNGVKSNSEARKKTNFSSLIYIARPK
jgi:SAM-dependent methyltransferase